MSALVGHDTDYAVYTSEDNCACVAPDEDTDTAAAYDAWDEDHPWGEGVSGWEGRICNLTPTGIFCHECSEDAGDWTGHTIRCHECGAAAPDCDCDETAGA